MGKNSTQPDDKKKKSGGAPAWMTTFADLMTLLLCFFVLLLSFSEMDRQKFKIMMGSFKEAFGVQRVVKVWDLPKGMDIVSMHFNDPTFSEMNLMEQLKSAIKTASKKGGDEEKEKGERGGEDLAGEGIVINEDEVSVTVTFPEKVLFDSGSAQIKKEAGPVMDTFGEIIGRHPHKVMVVGHTDPVPINTERYPSNWELSAARASSIIRYFLEGRDLDPSRFVAVGKAYTEPLAPNDTPGNRAKNRRVQLVFIKKLAIEKPKKGKPSSPFAGYKLSSVK